MQYCKRCCYPANTKPMILIDEKGICSGCRYAEKTPSIDYAPREKILREMLEKYQREARERGNPYDCIIPISGGKDSHFQAYLMKKVYGLNPLLVCYNHVFNSVIGIRNLNNIVKQFGCDLIRFTSSPAAARKISRYMLKKVGDVTWHYHAGIMTFPIQIAVRYKIPLVIWGEQGFADMMGMFRHEDMLEFSKKVRREHDMRGFEPEDILNDPANTEITREDLAPFNYPSDEEIDAVGVRGIYLSNFIKWDARAQTEKMIKEYNFQTAVKKERTFNLHDKTDDAANEVHDYLKYLKFGYGRCTDDASFEIRSGRMTREEGVDMVAKYDHVKPSSLAMYLKFVGLSEPEFFGAIEKMRDKSIWEKSASGEWKTNDSILNHKNEPGVEEAKLPQKSERTNFIVNNVDVEIGRPSEPQTEFITL